MEIQDFESEVRFYVEYEINQLLQSKYGTYFLKKENQKMNYADKKNDLKMKNANR